MTKIQWTDATWNPTTGCSRVSEGCRNCYIERTPPFRMAGRKMGDPVQLHSDRLDAPLHWKKPRRVFVNSLSDLFHEDVPETFLRSIFWTMGQAKNHIFQVLTKRPTRMRRTLNSWKADGTIFRSGWGAILPNVWLGVSVEDQHTTDERIPILLQVPAAVRFVSVEPLLSPVNLTGLTCRGCGTRSRKNLPADALDCCPEGTNALDWVIVGGESGPKSRPCDVAWIRSIVRQCQRAVVPCFVKQLGSLPYGVEGSLDAEEWGAFDSAVAVMDDCGFIHCQDKKGGNPQEWPMDLRVREWP
ncbi:MAG: phage Gp37/Gp68 family protein [Nitrospira sp.]|nr:phage Gp37/Gp68 family protein [Nitrospira sp.]